MMKVDFMLCGTFLALIALGFGHLDVKRSAQTKDIELDVFGIGFCFHLIINAWGLHYDEAQFCDIKQNAGFTSKSAMNVMLKAKEIAENNIPCPLKTSKYEVLDKNTVQKRVDRTHGLCTNTPSERNFDYMKTENYINYRKQVRQCLNVTFNEVKIFQCQASWFVGDHLRKCLDPKDLFKGKDIKQMWTLYAVAIDKEFRTRCLPPTTTTTTTTTTVATPSSSSTRSSSSFNVIMAAMLVMIVMGLFIPIQY